MVELAITKISSRGQIVIPADMRKGFSKGQKLLLIRDGNRFLLKRASDLRANVQNDLFFAKRTEDAIARYEQGLFREMPKAAFLEELKKW